MTIKANKIKIGNMLFTIEDEESKKSIHRASPQEQVNHTDPVPRKEEIAVEYKAPQDQVELQFDSEPIVRNKGHSFILKSSSKFHRDMIE